MIALAPGAADNGLASMLAEMLRQSLEDKPHKRRDFEALRARIAIVAEDAGVSLTLHFQRGLLTVYDGIVGLPDVTVRGASDDILNLSLLELRRIPLLGWVPDPRGETMRKIVSAYREGRLQSLGPLAHAPWMLRLLRVMSVQG